MSRVVRMIVPLTPSNVMTPEDVNFLRGINVSEEWLFEYVLAMYGVMEDLRTLPEGEDHMWQQLASDIDDLLFLNVQDPSTAEAQNNANQSFAKLFQLMRKIMDQLRPYVDPVSQGLPNCPVEVITYEPFIIPPKNRVLSPVATPPFSSSVLSFHLEDPNPDWLRSHQMWKDANDESPI